jgi:preprotein translocase subunit Sss1
MLLIAGIVLVISGVIGFIIQIQNIKERFRLSAE